MKRNVKMQKKKKKKIPPRNYTLRTLKFVSHQNMLSKAAIVQTETRNKK